MKESYQTSRWYNFVLNDVLEFDEDFFSGKNESVGEGCGEGKKKPELSFESLKFLFLIS